MRTRLVGWLAGVSIIDFYTTAPAPRHLSPEPVTSASAESQAAPEDARHQPPRSAPSLRRRLSLKEGAGGRLHTTAPSDALMLIRSQMQAARPLLSPEMIIATFPGMWYF